MLENNHKIKPNVLLQRSSQGVIAGVARGLSSRLDIDVIWIRLGFIFTTWFFGFGLVTYFILAFSLPREDRLEHAFDNKIFGVCSRLALRFEFDIAVTRALFLFFLISSFGTAFFAYVVLYFVLPDKNTLINREGHHV